MFVVPTSTISNKEIVMAWTDACKSEAVAQIDHKVKQGASVREALAELSKESGIPSGTIRRWKYPESSVPKNGNTQEKKEISEQRAWNHVEKTLDKLAEYILENCNDIEGPDPDIWKVIRFHIDTIELLTDNLELEEKNGSTD